MTQLDLPTLAYRLDAIEKQIPHMVPEREADLRFQAMIATVERIEKQIEAVNDAQGKMKDAQEKLKSDVDKLQIRVLVGILMTIVSFGGYILINFLKP